MSALTQPRPCRASIGEVLGTLDELAQATRAHDRGAYTIALEVAATQRLSDDQIRDAYDWGTKTSRAGWPAFDWQGRVRHV